MSNREINEKELKKVNLVELDDCYMDNICFAVQFYDDYTGEKTEYYVFIAHKLDNNPMYAYKAARYKLGNTDEVIPADVLFGYPYLPDLGYMEIYEKYSIGSYRDSDIAIVDSTKVKGEEFKLVSK